MTAPNARQPQALPRPACTPMALIAPLARVARSANRSTLYHGDHRIPSQNVTAAPADQRARD